MKKLTWDVLRTKGKIFWKYIFYQPSVKAIPGEYQPARSNSAGGETAASSVQSKSVPIFTLYGFKHGWLIKELLHGRRLKMSFSKESRTTLNDFD